MTVPSTDPRPDAPSGDRGATVPAADVRRVLRLGMRVAITMLGSGAQTDDVETAIETIGRAYGIDPIQRSAVPKFYADFFGKPSALNTGHTVTEYWMEQTKGRIGATFTPYLGATFTP